MEFLEQRPWRLYKYIRINKAVDWLLGSNGGKLVFVEPDVWEDPTERALYNAHLLDSMGNEYTPPKVFTSCFTKNQASDASWTVYQHQRLDDTRPRGCVKLSIKFANLLSQLRLWIKTEEKRGCKFSLHYGNIIYREWDDIERLQIGKSRIRQEVFNAGASIEENFLKLLLLKRKAFEYENELRVFLVLEEGEADGKELNVPINWDKCLKTVYYNKECDLRELEKLKNSSFGRKVEPSTLLDEKERLTIKLPNKQRRNEKTKL